MSKRKIMLIVLLAFVAAMLTMAVIPPGGANCSPGFWKQEQHFQYWNGFSPSDPYLDTGMTLLDALQGGKATIESRFIVAGWLNEAAEFNVCPDEILE